MIDGMDEGAQLRMKAKQPSRGACWQCGLRREATIHHPEAGLWWSFHPYEPAILTKTPENQTAPKRGR